MQFLQSVHIPFAILAILIYGSFLLTIFFTILGLILFLRDPIGPFISIQSTLHQVIRKTHRLFAGSWDRATLLKENITDRLPLISNRTHDNLLTSYYTILHKYEDLSRSVIQDSRHHNHLMGRLSTLRADNKALETDLNTITSRYEEHLTKIRNLKRDHHLLESSHKTVLDERDRIGRENSRIREELATYHAVNESLRTELARLNNQDNSNYSTYFLQSKFKIDNPGYHDPTVNPFKPHTYSKLGDSP